jgi:hypothetical protein
MKRILGSFPAWRPVGDGEVTLDAVRALERLTIPLLE